MEHEFKELTRLPRKIHLSSKNAVETITTIFFFRYPAIKKCSSSNSISGLVLSDSTHPFLLAVIR